MPVTGQKLKDVSLSLSLFLQTRAGQKGAMASTPLLEPQGRREEEEERWWRRCLDLEEAKSQFYFAVPMILTNVSFYGITLVSVMFAGHLGELELAGSTLGNSWSMVTGIALMVFHFSY